MNNQLEPTKAKIVALAKAARGSLSRRDMFGAEQGISFNTYANFESGQSWPRAAGLRRIESILGWKNGAIDEALASGVQPAHITEAHMRGDLPFTPPKSCVRELSDEELFQEVVRRLAVRDQYGLAASQDLGGIGKDDVES